MNIEFFMLCCAVLVASVGLVGAFIGLLYVTAYAVQLLFVVSDFFFRGAASHIGGWQVLRAYKIERKRAKEAANLPPHPSP